jgi:predicted phage tail protein
MKLQNLTCNHCGAPLQVPESANYVTCNHCSAQLAVRRSKHVAFTEQINKLAETTERLSRRVEDLSGQGKLAALDREWELKRADFMMTGKNGQQFLPSESGAIGGGVTIAIFGSLWTVMAIAMTSAAPSFGPFIIAKFIFPLFGICFVVGGIVHSFHQHSKAQAYREAERQYRQRRNEILHDGHPEDGENEEART